MDVGCDTCCGGSPARRTADARNRAQHAVRQSSQREAIRPPTSHTLGVRGRARKRFLAQFGVGNSTQAATLHPSVTRVELADLSRDILAHADYFAAGNKDVLHHPKLTVYINDGRQHLQMQPPGSFDLVTLEPPPIAYAGVGIRHIRAPLREAPRVAVVPNSLFWLLQRQQEMGEAPAGPYPAGAFCLVAGWSWLLTEQTCELAHRYRFHLAAGATAEQYV